MISPMLQGESSSSSSSRSSLNATTPSNGDSSLPIALREGTRYTHNPRPIYNFLSYHKLSPSYYSFPSSMSSITIPKNVNEVLDNSEGRQVMIAEM